MITLNKADAWIIYNALFKDHEDECKHISIYEGTNEDFVRDFVNDPVGVKNMKNSTDWCNCHIDSTNGKSKHIDEFNNLYGLLIDIAFECEPILLSDDDIDFKLSYFLQLSSMYRDIDPKQLRLWYAEGHQYKKSDNRLVELTVEQTKFIVCLGLIICQNAFEELRRHNKGENNA